MAEQARDVVIAHGAGTIVRKGDYRELKQGIIYRAGRAVEYRCPDCGQAHPLDRRDWDEGRGVYAGRSCAGKEEPRASSRAGISAYQRRRYADDLGFRERKRASVRG